MTRKHITERIAALDAEKDHQQIAYLLAMHAFHWDIRKALQFALFRTYAVPSISKLLSKTGEFKRRPRKRYDDTELILAEIAENGYDSPQAQRAFARMNQMHGSYRIANDDLLYVLSTFVFVPQYWIRDYAWRPMTEAEKLASFRYYREVGIRMGIEAIPEDMYAFEEFHHAYEATHFAAAGTNAEIAAYTMDLLLGFYIPPWLYWAGRPVARCLMDAPLLAAMGYQRPSIVLRSLVKAGLSLRKRAMRWMPERRTPYLVSQERRPTYPEGYRIEELGTFPRGH